MESVIPPLVQSLRQAKSDAVTNLSELFLSFVVAYKDIPTERRYGLFISLMDKVGPNDFLFALLVLFVDKYPGRQKVYDFAAELVAHQNVSTQLIVSVDDHLSCKFVLSIILDSRKVSSHSVGCLGF